jgi:hypothetical protein
MLGMTSAVAAASATAPTGGFLAVSCTSASACTAVGFSLPSSGGNMLLAERWNGKSWVLQRAPDPSGGRGSELDGVSCTSASACTAVGYYLTSAEHSVTLAERWDGKSWAVQTTPNPSGAENSDLEGVSCTSASACTAVGYYNTSTGPADLTLAERWNGTAWTVQTTPSLAGRDSNLPAVSCSSASACTAAGTNFPPTGPEVPLAERWDGKSWAVQTTLNPGGAQDTHLYAVSCTSASACTATGGYYDSSTGIAVNLAERWNGTAWAIQTTPNPGGAQVSGLTGVSCTSAWACTAAGIHYTSSGPDMTLAERWNGTAWAIQHTPNPGGSYGSDLNGVSCTSASACTAVGYYNTNSSTRVTLAERWNGTAWTVQPTPS